MLNGLKCSSELQMISAANMKQKFNLLKNDLKTIILTN